MISTSHPSTSTFIHCPTVQVACLVPASLTSPSYPAANQVATVVGIIELLLKFFYDLTYTKSIFIKGWSRTGYGRIPTYLSKSVQLSISNPSLCSNFSTAPNWNVQMCTRVSPLIDTCEGGPVYVIDKLGAKSKWILAGITSMGLSCAGSSGLVINFYLLLLRKGIF